MCSRISDASINSSNIITTDVIKRICVERGFYRNPICNETLYLHQKGFEDIDIAAFEPYTKVKVLWLEGNALKGIACGKDSVEDTRTVSTDDKTTEVKNVHVDCASDWTTTFVHETAASSSITEKEMQSSQEQPTTAINGSDESTVGVRRRDVFHTFYPTMRQLYLHNNVLHEMPDLSGFQRLDSVNLSGNYIRTIRAHCATFRERILSYDKESEAQTRNLLTNANSTELEEGERSASASSHDREQTDGSPPLPPTSVSLNKEEGNSATDEVVHEENSAKVEGDRGTFITCTNETGDSEAKALPLAEWERRAELFVNFCPHDAIEASEDGKLFDNIPPSRLNPCSSLRTLNLANNFLTDVRDLIELLSYKFLSTLDLSYNRLHDGAGILLVLERLPQLRSLKLCGNPLVRTLPRYRKTVLVRCGELLYLDDRPVFAAERRLVEAWGRGGEAEESRERQRMKEENDREHLRRMENFRAVVNRYTTRQEEMVSVNGMSANNGGEESATSSEEDSEESSGGASESGSGNNGVSNVNSREEEEEEGEGGEVEGKSEVKTRVVGSCDSDNDDDVYVPSV